jgi:hypothetical protein
MDFFHVSGLQQCPLLHMVPPAHEEVVNHQPEPRRQLNTIFLSVCLPDQLLHLITVHVLHVGYFFRIRVHLHVTDHEKEVIH